jgi:hypothetical protein
VGGAIRKSSSGVFAKLQFPLLQVEIKFSLRATEPGTRSAIGACSLPPPPDFPGARKHFEATVLPTVPSSSPPPFLPGCRRRLVNATVPPHLLSATAYRDALMAGGDASAAEGKKAGALLPIRRPPATRLTTCVVTRCREAVGRLPNLWATVTASR